MKLLYQIQRINALSGLLLSNHIKSHFATYPPDLIEPCILAGSEEGDTVLDPFMGAGTMAWCKSLNRDYMDVNSMKTMVT